MMLLLAVLRLEQPSSMAADFSMHMCGSQQQPALSVTTSTADDIHLVRACNARGLATGFTNTVGYV